MKKRTRDEIDAEKYAERTREDPYGDESMDTAFLAGVRYARRSDIAAINREFRLWDQFLSDVGDRGDALEIARCSGAVRAIAGAKLEIRIRSRK